MPQPPVVASLQRADEQRLTVRVDAGDVVRLLDYVGQGPTWERPPPTLDFVAVALAPLALATGRDLLVDGPVSSGQLESLARYVEACCSDEPRTCTPVTIGATAAVGTVDPGCRRGAVMAFDAGVDASFALAAHHDGLLGQDSRDIASGVLVVGEQLRPDDEAALTLAQEVAARALGAYDVGTRVVATNWFHQLCPPVPGATEAGLAALLATFAGSHDAMVVPVVHPDDRATSGGAAAHLPAVQHLLGAPHLPVVATGASHPGVERLRVLAGHPVLLAGLRFCEQPWGPRGRCGHCSSCRRTLRQARVAGLELAADPGVAPAGDPLALRRELDAVAAAVGGPAPERIDRDTLLADGGMREGAPGRRLRSQRGA